MPDFAQPRALPRRSHLTLARRGSPLPPGPRSRTPVPPRAPSSSSASARLLGLLHFLPHPPPPLSPLPPLPAPPPLPSRRSSRRCAAACRSFLLSASAALPALLHCPLCLVLPRPRGPAFAGPPAAPAAAPASSLSWGPAAVSSSCCGPATAETDAAASSPSSGPAAVSCCSCGPAAAEAPATACLASRHFCFCFFCCFFFKAPLPLLLPLPSMCTQRVWQKGVSWFAGVGLKLTLLRCGHASTLS